MKNVIAKRIALRLGYCYDCMQWWIEYCFFLRNHKNGSLLDNIDKSIVFLVPHADDDLLAGYKFSLLRKDLLTFAYFGMTGSNDSSDNKQIRDHEFKKFCEVAGFKYKTINKSTDLEDLLKNDCTIVLPSIVDWHEEHRKLNYILYDLIKKKELSNNKYRIIWYGVTVPISDEDFKIVLLSKKEQKEKYMLFKNIYVSQNFMPIFRFKVQERINAIGSGCYAGEAFLDVKYKDWKKITEFVRLDEHNPNGLVSELMDLRLHINNIRRIRQKSCALYKIINDNVKNQKWKDFIDKGK